MTTDSDTLLALKAAAFDLMRRAEAAEVEKARLLSEVRRLVAEIASRESISGQKDQDVS